jgi:hypothetical protein
VEVYKSIAAITGELSKEGISKLRKNQQQGFSYRGIDDVYAALSPLLSQYHLCILPRVVEREVTERINKNQTALFYTTLHVEFDFVSAVDGSKHTCSAYGEAMDSGDKSHGKAMSYAYKSMAFAAFAIPTEGDNDPDAKTHEVVAKQSQPISAPHIAPQQSPSSPEPNKDQEHIQRIKNSLRTIYGDDIKSGIDKVEYLTSFVPKGKAEEDRVKGVRDFTKLSGQRLTILCSALEKLAVKSITE